MGATAAKSDSYLYLQHALVFVVGDVRELWLFLVALVVSLLQLHLYLQLHVTVTVIETATKSDSMGGEVSTAWEEKPPLCVHSSIW